MRLPYTQRAPLLVLNASAGSGKTYRLVQEYLTLLFDPNASSGRFRNIVAMTFTNKAAYEMKDRILKALNEISNYTVGDEETYKLISAISADIHLPIDSFPQKASLVLAEILHSYEDFLISTIDKFNLKLIRSFNRDLNLPQEFEVILNETEILEKVIDSILAKVGKEEFPDLTRWVENYTRKNLEEETNWNFRWQLLSFCSILSKERYIPLVEDLVKSNFSEKDFHSAKKRMVALEQTLINRGKEIYQMFTGLGLREDQIYQRSKTVNSINQLANLKSWPEKGLLGATVIKGIEEDKYVHVFSAELIEALQQLHSFYSDHLEEYFKLKYFRDTFYNLALLQYVAKEMDEVRETERFIRISEFNLLISGLVRNQEAPYIYERLGNRLHHFLLDEFQDTSRMQWLNLIPLLEESISKQNKNLIVGDAKQSIYRFNNGLAEQFVALPRIYNPEGDPKLERKSDFFEQMGTLEELEHNHRSGNKIVSFNNGLFEECRTLIPPNAQGFYKAVRQLPTKKFEGYVEIKSEEKKDSALDIYAEILAIIERSISEGFKPGDICILSEKNNQGNEIAKFLTSHQYKVVSADSLLIHADARIRLVISYLKLRNRSSNHREFMKFADLYLRFSVDDPELAYLALFDVSDDGKRSFNAQRFTEVYFQSEDNFYLSYTNLYDLIQKFYDMLEWSETSDVYLHHFADICFNFQIGKRVDLNSFIEYYEKNQHKLAIQFPKTDDAIQIMTIHKSKGLQFPVVILPDIDFSISDRNSTYLIPGKDQVYFRQLSQKSPIEEIRNFSERESEQYFMDRLNLLYVAMTRPIHRLYAFNAHSKSKLGVKIHALLCKIHPEAVVGNSLHLQLGQPEHVNIPGSTDEFIFPTEFGDRLWYPELVVRQEFDNEHTLLGKAFHAVAADCLQITELDNAIDKLLNESQINPVQVNPLTAWCQGLLKNEMYLGWIQSSDKIHNEAWIMSPDSALLRPDKIFEFQDKWIVVDFKTGQKNPKHSKQLDAYCSLLKEMKPLLQVESYLYYVSSEEWVRC